MAAPAGVVTEADVRAAQTALDGLQDVYPVQLPRAAQLELRGLLAAFASEVRHAGYVEGVQRGRFEIGHAVLDALRDEGVAP